MTTRERAQAAPEIPPIAEQGFPEFESHTWAALYATGGTPAPVVVRLSAEVRRAARAPDVASRMRDLGYEVVAGDPENLAAMQAAEAERWGAVIRRAGIKPED